MYWYQVITSRVVPTITLVYSSERPLGLGTLVEVALGNQQLIGIVWSKDEVLTIDKSKIKPIIKVLPYRVSHQYIDTLSTIAFNTLTNLSDLVGVLLSIVAKISAKQIQLDYEALEPTQGNLLQQVTKTTVNTKLTKLEYYIEKEQWVRIRVIIRSLLSINRATDNFTPLAPILIIVPEQSQIAPLYTQLAELLSQDTVAGEQMITVSTFVSANIAASRLVLTSLFRDLCNNTVIIGSKSSLFLPYSALAALIVCDEYSTFYIQEQQSLYFDSRDVAFILATKYNCDLYCTSPIPSLRAHKTYSEAITTQIRTTYNDIATKLPTMQLYTRNKRDLFAEALSMPLLEKLGVERVEEQLL